MSARRLLIVLRADFGHFFRRPMAWIWILLLGFTAIMLAGGDMRISSGDSTVGGTKAWLTSQFAMAQMLSMVIFIFYMFFVAILSGMAVLRDEEHRVGEVLHATPLTTAEYIWGKFGAGVAAYLVVLAIHIALSIFANHVLPTENAAEIRGPFSLANYLVPALVFGLPPILFLAGTTFAIGTWSRRPILVFTIPVAAILVCGFFLWNWSPSWLSVGWNRALMLIEPAGFRWLNETWLKVDRGVEFYNTAPIAFDGGFLLSRLGLVVIGLASVALAERRFARQIRGRAKVRTTGPVPAAAAAPPAPVRLRDLGMAARGRGFVHDALAVWRFEARELWASPGLYLFVPIIIVQILGNAMIRVGAFDTRLLNTSGSMAVSSMNTITLLVCLLLLFYIVESLIRERSTGIHPVFYATPVRTGAVLFGKALAGALIPAVIFLASFLACVIAILFEKGVPIEVAPFLLSWVLLLTPTFLAWSAFVMAVQATAGNRYTTYAVGLSVLILCGWLQVTGRMNWAGNWNLWSAVLWSDMGVFELNREPLILNRLMALSLVPLFLAYTVRVFDRRERDAVRTLHRLSPGPLLRGALRLVPYAVLPVALGVALYVQVHRGWQGRAAEEQAHDYWKGNLATWKDAPLPRIAGADVTIDLHPRDRALVSTGTFTFVNHHDTPLAGIPLTMGAHWDSLAWTMDGEPYEPKSKSFLHVFAGERGVAPGDTVLVGWRAGGEYPEGITRNGGGSDTFVLPMATVLTSFDASFTPVLGFQDGVGVDEKNALEPREYPLDCHEGLTRSAFGSDTPFPVRTVITGPEELTLNGIGTLVEESVTDGRRKAVWVSDHPVTFFNVVAGRWDVRRGQGTALYYHPAHRYNVDEMLATMDAARRWYSEWFYPYPWRELKISEFPALAYYAQGFATNITFSEGIGFLTKSTPENDAAFMVTAHEIAHQWWGNLLVPGDRPGGEVLSEGMAHFSTALLFEQVKGDRARMGFLKNIEDRYGERRQADSERPLVRLDGSRPGDTTVLYDKGGWVFWMLLRQMGREAGLAGYRDFIERFMPGPDHALLQDFVAVMREHAPDSTAFDAFARQWFYEVVLPEYRVSEAKAERAGDGWTVTCRVENAGTGRMPVEIAAARGKRFPEENGAGDGSKDVAAAGADASLAAATDPDGGGESEYQEVRTTVTLGAGESAVVTLTAPFEPKEIVVDPDVQVLMLERKRARADL